MTYPHNSKLCNYMTPVILLLVHRVLCNLVAESDWRREKVRLLRESPTARARPTPPKSLNEK